MSIPAGAIGIVGAAGVITSTASGGGSGGTMLVDGGLGRRVLSQDALSKTITPGPVQLFRGLGVRADESPETFGTVEIGELEAFVWK